METINSTFVGIWVHIKVKLCGDGSVLLNAESQEIRTEGKLTAWHTRSFEREEKKAMLLPAVGLTRQDG
jgi:hypothetical protein